MKVQYMLRQGMMCLLALVMLNGCGKKDPEPLPLDESSGAPLVPLSCGAYRTFTQAEWDQPAGEGPSPGYYRDINFALAFQSNGANGLVIGIPSEAGREYIRFTTSAALMDFFPQTGPPAPITVGAENPPAGRQFSAFAGELVALKLNLYYDDYERRRTPLRTGQALRYLTIGDGPLQHLNLERLLFLGERALGGDPATSATYLIHDGTQRTYTFNIQVLYDAARLANENFAGGNVNKNYLVCR